VNLHDIHRGIHKNRDRNRVGRGPGSGNGKTAGKGSKGHRSRSGYSRKPFFQGGTMPLFRRIPKRGFHNPFAPTVAAINVGSLDELFAANAEITPELLSAEGLIRGRFDELKILGDGEVSKPLRVQAHRFSKTAREKIERAGGSVVVLTAKRTPRQRVAELKAGLDASKD
jgi:large subunit ribosomal protein L15